MFAFYSWIVEFGILTHVIRENLMLGTHGSSIRWLLKIPSDIFECRYIYNKYLIGKSKGICSLIKNNHFYVFKGITYTYRRYQKH